MKKLSLIALAAASLLPNSMMAATEVVDTIKTKADFTAALTTTAATLKAGETLKLVCAWDASTPLNIGNVSTTMNAGKLIITSDETEYDKMPQMLVGLNWTADLLADGKVSIMFKNIGLQYRTGKEATSGQIVYLNGISAPMDSLVFQNCDISNYPRTLYRVVPKTVSEEDETYIPQNINVVEMTGCRVHDCNVTSGNNWPILYVDQAANKVTIKDNIFYNMPYCKAIYNMNRVSETGTTATFDFENNTVLHAKTTNNNFQVINASDKFALGSTFNINNNIFIAPQAGEYVNLMQNDETQLTGDGVILNCNNAIVYASNNVIDPVGFKSLESNDPNANGENPDAMWYVAEINNSYTPDQAGITSWNAGDAFQDPEKSLYYMLKSSQAYTMGTNGTYLGSANTYVDAFPTKAALNISITGPSYITYTISPEKAQYYAGEEVVITLNTHNSMYRTFNTFKGWNDGSMETSRTITLGETNDLVATFEGDNNVVAAFDFSTITSNVNIPSYDADIYFNMDPAYLATVKAVVCDTASTKVAPFDYIDGNFQGRAGKFGEDDEELQMAIISRRTAAIAKEAQRDYAVIEFSTKNLNNIKFSAYVGTDNNAAKVQNLEYSLDGKAWTNVASVELEEAYQWYELEATLPSALENQDKAYLRIIGDPAQGHIVDGIGCTEDIYTSSDSFEYIGNILISADTTNGIVNVTTNDSKNLNENAPIYNIMGMKVAKGAKGMLIQNGKKFIVK